MLKIRSFLELTATTRNGNNREGHGGFLA